MLLVEGWMVGVVVWIIDPLYSMCCPQKKVVMAKEQPSTSGCLLSIDLKGVSDQSLLRKTLK